MSLTRKVKRRINSLIRGKDAKISYSQCGEDLIIRFIFEMLKKDTISYLDIGAHHPTYINNTALFYKTGSTGVSIEPDPFLFETIQTERSKDVNLNIGIGGGQASSEADFYVLSEKTLNTFSKEEAERCVSYGNKKIEKIVKLPLVPINEIMTTYFNPAPDFISLDVEGYDIVILKSFDFEKFRPTVWCIETLTYTEDKTERKIKETIDFMISKNYFVYADTYINTIFVDKETWLKRK
jgi:FkbM family methyltransferase